MASRPTSKAAGWSARPGRASASPTCSARPRRRPSSDRRLPIGPRRARCTIVDVKLLAVALVLVLAVRTAGAQPGMVDPDPPPPPQRSQVPLPRSSARAPRSGCPRWDGRVVRAVDRRRGARDVLELADRRHPRVGRRGRDGDRAGLRSLVRRQVLHARARPAARRCRVAFIGLLVAIGGCPLFDGGHGDETDSDCGTRAPAPRSPSSAPGCGSAEPSTTSSRPRGA